MNGRWSPMAAACPTSGIIFQGRLQVGGAHVFAAGRDDQLLLAVDDAQVGAGVVQLADVSGVQPPSSVSVSAVFSGALR